MDDAQFWKNFDLGVELEISGRFIYNGLRQFFELETLHYEAEIFEVLYNLSVGLERLLKISVVLIEHDSAGDQEEFEKTLITHSHIGLLDRVKKKHDLPFAAPHNSFLQMLSVFYKRHRYARFALGTSRGVAGEKIELHRFLEKQLDITISDDAPFNVSMNSDRIKKYLSRMVGKIARSLYRVVGDEANRLNLYTYELRSDSKAARVFLYQDCDFTKEDVLWKELLLFYLQAEEPGGHLGALCSLSPLEFDPGLESEYLQCFRSEEKKLHVLGELDALYGEIPDPGERLRTLSLIGDPGVIYDFEEFVEDMEEDG